MLTDLHWVWLFRYLFAVELKLVATNTREADGYSKLVLKVLEGWELIKWKSLDSIERWIMCWLVQLGGEWALLGRVQTELEHHCTVLVRLDETLGVTDRRHSEFKERVLEIRHLAKLVFTYRTRQQLYTSSTQCDLTQIIPAIGSIVQLTPAQHIEWHDLFNHASLTRTTAVQQCVYEGL